MPAVYRHLSLLAALMLLLLVAGCSARRSGGSATTGVHLEPVRWPAADGTLADIRAGCDDLAGPVLPGGTFVCAVAASVQPARAPVPHNRAERIVFAQLYETLVEVGCDGRPAPGLASHWTCTEDSTTWVFTLRDGARFWDGTRVTAEAVRTSWRANQADPATDVTASPWSWINARASSITAVDARRLAVQLPEPQADFPLLLAHPAAAVAVRREGWTWPVGSGPARLRASDPAPRPDIALRPNPHHPRVPNWDALVFRVQPDADLRDLVAEQPDLLLVRRSEDAEFYRMVPGYAVHALPWDRLYLLVTPPAARAPAFTGWGAAVAALDPARDVTAVAARSWPDITFPAGGAPDCPQLSGPITGARAAPLDSELGGRRLDERTIVYPRTDPAAGELAGRLSHLAGGDARIAGLADRDFDLALQWRMAGAFVVVQDQLFPTGCLQVASLLGRAAWLQELGLDRPAAAAAGTRSHETLGAAERLALRTRLTAAQNLADQGVVHPLVLARRWLVARGELAGLQLDFDGIPRLEGLGRAAAPGATP